MQIINVFIGSSSKFIYNDRTRNGNKPNAKLKKVIGEIEAEIEQKGWKTKVEIKIKPWWHYFKEAGTLLGSFSKILQENDIGIFVMGKDILTEHKRIKRDSKNVKKKKSFADVFFPNLNVIAEFGMFNAIGKTTFIIKESGEIKLPSDMSGLNDVSLERPNEVVTGFLQTLEEFMANSVSFETSDYEKICSYYDTTLSNKLTALYEDYNPEFIQWETKALYVGSKSANLWKKAESNRNYNEYLTVRQFINDHESEIKSLRVQNVISFGPGAGKVDSELMKNLRDTYYIPIDLNVSLAIKSAKRMTDIKGCHVPFAVIDDFEEPSFYKNFGLLIEARKSEIGKYNLFSLLGVTFSNLSMTCNDFFTNMSSLMKDYEDYLLVDAIIYDEETNEELENIVRSQINNHYSDLIINSITKKRLRMSPKEIRTKNPVLEITTIDNQDDEEYIQRVSIPNTKLLCVKYEGNILLIAKFYKYDNLSDYISKFFDIRVKDRINNRGVFLLKKKDLNRIQ